MKTIYVIIFLSLSVFAGEYHVDKEADNLVKFVSDAPIEDFEGITKNIDGYIYWQGDDLVNKSELYFEVDLNTVDTGIGLRNRHMRENYLHTDNYPKTHFTGKLITAKKIKDDQYEVEAEGEFYVHGVKKEKKVSGQLQKIDGDRYQISAKFTVPLSEHNIEVPSIMFYKIDENMELNVVFFVKKAPEGESE